MGIAQSYHIIPPAFYVASNRRVLAVEWETRKGLSSEKGSPSEWLYLYKEGVKQEPPRPVIAKGIRHGMVVFCEEEYKISINTKYSFRWYSGTGMFARLRKESREFEVINPEAEERNARDLEKRQKQEAVHKWTGLPESTKAAIRRVFRLMDKDGDRSVSRKELAEFVANLGLEVSMSDIDRMLKDADKDGNMSLDYEEYKRAVLDAMEYSSSPLWRQIYLMISGNERQAETVEPRPKRQKT